MIHLYEQNHLPVDEKLIIQYLQNPKIAKEFAVYYDLFNKYRSDYQVDKILAGKATKASASVPLPPSSTSGCPCWVCCWTPPPASCAPWWSGRRCCGSCLAS